MRRWIIAATLVVVSVVAGSGFVNAAEAAPLPSSMAAIGDSITRAVDVCCWYGNHPSNSWSTGGASWDGVTSHYERIRAQQPAGRARYDDAVSGARMSDAPGQAAPSVFQGAGT